MSILSSLFGFLGAGSAAGKVNTANVNAERGVLGAAQGASTGVVSAGDSAKGLVDARTTDSNTTLQKLIEEIRGDTQPYRDAGSTGVSALSDLVTSKPQFSFTPQDLQNEPGYQFQLNQGTEAINNSASSKGTLQSGNTLKALTEFGQGLAGTSYQNAFNRAKTTFDTNQDTTLKNALALTDSGVRGTSIYDQSLQNLGGQQAQNTRDSGYYGGNTDTSLAKFLAELNVGAAKTAGDYAVNAGNASAAGTLGKFKSLAGISDDIGGIIKQLFGGGG